MNTRKIIPIYVSYIVSGIGSSLSGITLLLYLIHISDAKSIIAVYLIIYSLPSILFGVFISGVLNKISLKVVLIMSEIVAGILIVLIPHCKVVWQILVVSFFLSISRVFFRPCISSIIPELVGSKDTQSTSDQLIKINSFLSLIRSSLQVVAVIIGGVIISYLGYSIPFYVDAVTFYLSAIVLLFLESRHPNDFVSETIQSDEFTWRKFFKNFASKYFRDLLLVKDSVVKYFVCTSFLTMLGYGIFNASLLIYAVDYLEYGPIKALCLFISDGCGMFLGGVLFCFMSKKLKMFNSMNLVRIYNACLLLSSITFLLFASFNSYTLLLLFDFMTGFFAVSAHISRETYLQDELASNIRAGVFSMVWNIGSTANLLALAITGVIISYISISTIIKLVSFPFAISMLYGFIITLPIIKTRKEVSYG